MYKSLKIYKKKKKKYFISLSGFESIEEFTRCMFFSYNLAYHTI